MACKLNAGFCKVGLVLVVVCFTLMFMGCLTSSGTTETANTPTESVDDNIYVLSGSDTYDRIVGYVSTNPSNPSKYEVSFPAWEEGKRELIAENSLSRLDVSYSHKYDFFYGSYTTSDIKCTFDGNPYYSGDLKVYTLTVRDGIFASPNHFENYPQEVQDTFRSVLDETKLGYGAISIVFHIVYEAEEFLLRASYYDQGKRSLHDFYSYRSVGRKYLPDFTTITEEEPPVEVVSKYKTFKVSSMAFKEGLFGFSDDIGPDGWKDTFDEGYRYGLSSYAETGYDEYGLYDIIDGWKDLKNSNLLVETYAMSLKLKSKGDGFYVTEGGWKVYSTNRQNAKSLDDAWNSSSKTVNRYGLCYRIGLVPAGENKYELVLYAMTRT